MKHGSLFSLTEVVFYCVLPPFGIAVMFIIALLLTGCATYPELHKAGASPKELEGDRTLCQFEVEKAMLGRTRSASDVIVDALDSRQDRSRMTNLCLQSKGWR